MRSAAALRRVCFGVHYAASCFGVGRKPEQMADRVDEIRAVHGVEVEIAHPAIDQVEHLLGGDGGGDQLARRRIVVEPVEARGEPVRHRGAGTLRKALRLLEVLHRQDARGDGNRDAARAHAVEIAEVEIVLEEELRDRAARAGIDLGGQHVDVGIHRSRVRMLLRVGRDRHFDVGDALDAGNQIGAVGIAAGVRRVFLADAADRIAAQRHDVAHAGLVISADDVIDLATRRAHAGQMRGRRQRGLGEDTLHRRVGALARRAAGAVGDRHEVRPQRREPLDRLPQRALHLFGLRREELERHADAGRADMAAGTFDVTHHATP